MFLYGHSSLFSFSLFFLLQPHPPKQSDYQSYVRCFYRVHAEIIKKELKKGGEGCRGPGGCKFAGLIVRRPLTS